MGVDCNIILFRPVKISFVADAIGVMLGNPHEFYKIKGSNGLFHRVHGYKFYQMAADGTECSSYGTLNFSHESGRDLSLFYSLEHREGLYLSNRSRPIIIAVGKRLVRFFGGKLITQDCSDDLPFVVAKPGYDTQPEDNQEWDILHQLIHDIPLLTKEEIDLCYQESAYDHEGRWR